MEKDCIRSIVKEFYIKTVRTKIIRRNNNVIK